MERKASILSLVGMDAKDSALMVRIFTLVLGLSLLAVTAVAVFVLSFGVEPGVSPAAVAGVEVSSAGWNAMGETFGKDLGFILDEANPRWIALTEYLGGEVASKDLEFVLDEANPRWIALTEYLGGEVASKELEFVLDEANPRWIALTEYLGGEVASKELEFVLDEANPRWIALTDHFAGQPSVTHALHDARRNARDERFKVEYGRTGCTSACFGPALRRGVGGSTAQAVPSDYTEDSSRDY